MTPSHFPINDVNWTPIGPAPIVNGQVPGSEPVSGRIAALAADPGNANIIYVAAAGGGVWKTTNGGTSWTSLLDSGSVAWGGVQPVDFMGAIVIAPSNSSVIYAGTGEANGLFNTIDPNTATSVFYGRGVLKSTDGGSTWTLMGNSVFDRRSISKIVVDPANPDIVYVAIGQPGINGLTGNTGIWKSIDGGVTWSNTTAASGISSTVPFSDLVMDPSNALHLFAAAGAPQGDIANGLYETTNGGATWALSTGGGTFPTDFSDGRIALAVSPSNPLRMYASIDDPFFFGLNFMLRSDNGGATWSDITLNVLATEDYLSGQGFYDTTLAVDPTNPDRVYAGGGGDPFATGSQIIESTNGGLSWTDISNTPFGANGPHADHHAIGFDASGKLLVGTDGGIWRLENPTFGSIDWADINGNLETTTFIGTALDPTNPEIVYGGSQDNGTEKYTGSVGWSLIQLGDGGFVRVNSSNPNIVFHEFFGISLERSDDGGLTWNGKTTGINPFDAFNFYVPYVMDPSNPSRLLLGTDRVYETTNSGDSWTPLSSPGTNGWVAAEPIDALAAAPTDANTIYATAGGHIFVTFNHGVTWQHRDAGRHDHFSDIIVDPTSNLVAYAVSDQFGGGHVWRTTNGGASWTDISGNLPDVPTWTIAQDPRAAGFGDDVLYIGNDNGVYDSTNLGVSWARYGAGLPNAQVRDLELSPQLGVLAAGTHGRGVWEICPIGSPTLQFAVSSYSVNENAGTVTITVTRYGCRDTAVSVDYSTTPVTATAGTDYTTTAGTLSFGINEATKTFTVPIIDDFFVEPNETFTVTLSNPTGGATLGTPTTTTVTIVDDDVAGQVQFSSPTYSVNENGVFATITVTRTGGAAAGVTVDYTTFDITATAGLDYTAEAGTLTFGHLETSKTFTVPITYDTLVEGTEQVFLALLNPTGGASLGNPNTATLSIIDGIIVASGQPGTFLDNDGDQFTISLKGPGDAAVYIDSIGPVDSILLTGTTTSTSLQVSVRQGQLGDGKISIDEITGAGSLKVLKAPQAKLTGAGISLLGSLQQIFLSDLLNGADILVGGGALTPMKLSLGSVGTGSVISTTSTISSLLANNLFGSTVTAPTIGTLTIAKDKLGNGGRVSGSTVTAAAISKLIVQSDVLNSVIMTIGGGSKQIGGLVIGSTIL